MSSIRSKITLIYLALVLSVGVFVLFASFSLRYLEQRVNEGVAIAAFQETTQEMRRHEKNFFLYRAPADLAAARDLAAELETLLVKDRAILAELTQVGELTALAQVISHYRVQLASGMAEDEAIRAAGHEILTHSELLAKRERASLVASAQHSRHLLLWSVLVLVLLALVGGQILYRVVVRPLRQLEQQLAPLAQGRFRAFTMVSQDREIVSFTQALNRMLGELELRRRQVLQSEKLASLGTLASGVAHELNNPLGNISGAAQIALEESDALPEASRIELQGWLRQIDDETERARRIVDILLDYSRRPSQVNPPTALREVIEKSLLLLRPRLPQTDTVSFDVSPELRLCMDPQRMQQIFINLIQNALAAGGERVHVHISASAAPPDWPPLAVAQGLATGTAQVLGVPLETTQALLIQVCDDGPGIAAERISKVFDPFYTTHEPGAGTGLGLYVVAEIVQEQNGAVAVTSTPGEGTCFHLWLPCGAAK